MNVVAVSEIVEHWGYVAPALRPVTNDAEYDQALDLLNELLDRGATNEDHPLADLARLIGDIISCYETEHDPVPVATGVQCLRFFMDQHRLKYDDLRDEIGTKGVVADILSGRRKLNLRQVSALAKRFAVSTDVFID